MQMRKIHIPSKHSDKRSNQECLRITGGYKENSQKGKN